MKRKINYNVLILIPIVLSLIACGPAKNEKMDPRDIITVTLKDFNKVNEEFIKKGATNALCFFEFNKSFDTGEIVNDDFNGVILTCKNKEMSIENITNISNFLKSMIPKKNEMKSWFSSKHQILYNKMLYILQKKSLNLSNHLINIEMCYDQLDKYQASDFSNLYRINVACNEVLYIIDNKLDESADNLSKTYAQLAAKSYIYENKSISIELKVILDFILNAEVSEEIGLDRLLDFKTYMRFQYIRLNKYDNSTLANKLKAKVKEMENGTNL